METLREVKEIVRTAPSPLTQEEMLAYFKDMELTDEQKKANEERKAYWNELVEVKLFKDNNKYKDDVFVSVNGENCVIKRGIRVKIKRKFAELLDKSDLQDYETSMLIEKKSSEFAKSEVN